MNRGAMACRLPCIRANIIEHAKIAMIGDVCLMAMGSAIPRKMVSSIMGAMITARRRVVERIQRGVVVSEKNSNIRCDSRGTCKCVRMPLMMSAVKMTGGMIAM